MSKEQNKQSILIKRSRTLKAIRDFFIERGYVEVETPIAVKLPGQEPYLHPVQLTLTDDKGRTHQYFLHTSPEYAMKKLLAQGFEKIFQITKAFRNNESFGGAHQPEFTMLEWYSVKTTYLQLADEVDKLLSAAANAWGIKLKLPCERASITELFKKFANTTLDDWQTKDYNTYQENFFRIFLSKIEPNLPTDPIMLFDYPLALGALAQKKTNNPNYVERFELFINKLEIANAFGELLDAKEQKARFEAEQKIRLARGERPFAIDEELLEALPKIPNPTSGIALGIDRLMMALAQTNNIEDVIAFPF